MPTTGLDVITNAMFEIRVARAGDVLNPEDAAFGLSKVNRLIDNWNADNRTVYASDLSAYVITPGLGAHTIGPAGATWTAPRPVKLIAASLLEPVALPTWQRPLKIFDVSWWQQADNPNLTAAEPEYAGYLPDYPLGVVMLYPIPTVANGILLETWTVLSALTLAGTVALPPGYEDAITLTLAEDLASAFGQQASAMLTFKAREARARIFANNNQTDRRISTLDSGMPSQGGGTWDYLTGSM
jgi:hypothetical protein